MEEQSEFDKQKEIGQLKENVSRRQLNWGWDITGIILIWIVICLFCIEKLTGEMTEYKLVDLIILAVIVLGMFLMHYRFNEKIWQLEKEIYKSRKCCGENERAEDTKPSLNKIGKKVDEIKKKEREAAMTEKTNGIFTFEYKVLQKRMLHDSKIAYTVMGFMIPASIGILTWIIIEEVSNFLELLAAYIASIGALIVTYGIDRRFSYTSCERKAQMNLIEKTLKMYNERIYDHRDDIPAELDEEIKYLREKEKSIFANVSVHTLFRVYILLFGFAWVILILRYHFPF